MEFKIRLESGYNCWRCDLSPIIGHDLSLMVVSFWSTSQIHSAHCRGFSIQPSFKSWFTNLVHSSMWNPPSSLQYFKSRYGVKGLQVAIGCIQCFFLWFCGFEVLVGVGALWWVLVVVCRQLWLSLVLCVHNFTLCNVLWLWWWALACEFL
jgi:hypothetical protein